MLCPECGHDTKVTRSWPSYNSVIRERQCLECGYKWTTAEITLDEVQFIVKQDCHT